MVVEITGSTSGQSPFDVFVCDPTNVSCFYVSGLTTLTPIVTFDTNNYFPNEDYLYLKIIDTNGCQESYLLDCTGP